MVPILIFYKHVEWYLLFHNDFSRSYCDLEEFVYKQDYPEQRKKIIWSPPEEAPYCDNIWAPEITLYSGDMVYLLLLQMMVVEMRLDVFMYLRILQLTQWLGEWHFLRVLLIPNFQV